MVSAITTLPYKPTGPEGAAAAVSEFSPGWLMELAGDNTPQGRMLLANAVSDLLNVRADQAELSLITDILMEIVARAELDVRRALAERLARQSNAPHNVIVWLANDEIQVARPVIVLSDVLQDDDLLNIIQRRDAEYRRLIAQRTAMGSRVINSLILSHDDATLQTLLENQQIVFEESSLRLLVAAAKRKEPLKRPLLTRPEINADMALSIYWWVSQELRQTIQTRYTINRALIDEALEDTIDELLAMRRTGIETMTPEIRYVAQQLVEARRVTSGMLITTLRRGQVNLFVALFAELLRLPLDKVNAMLSHPSGEFLAVCCRAQGILKPDFASIFLLGRAARSGERVINPQELSQMLQFYDRLSMNDASSLLEAWQRDHVSLNLTHADISVSLELLRA